jgi:hypothetical protein
LRFLEQYRTGLVQEEKAMREKKNERTELRIGLPKGRMQAKVI